MSEIYPALNERIAEALTDGFNFSEGLLKELSAIINRVIEDYSKAGLPFTKALAELEQPEPGEFTKLARSCIPPREVFDNIPITEISERPGILENVVHTACDIIDNLNAELKRQAEQIKELEHCPECGSIDTKIFVDKLNFGTIDVFAPLYKCNKCHFKWSDWVSDEVYEKNKAKIDCLIARNRVKQGLLEVTENMLSKERAENKQQAERIEKLEKELKNNKPQIEDDMC